MSENRLTHWDICAVVSNESDYESNTDNKDDSNERLTLQKRNCGGPGDLDI